MNQVLPPFSNDFPPEFSKKELSAQNEISNNRNIIQSRLMPEKVKRLDRTPPGIITRKVEMIVNQWNEARITSACFLVSDFKKIGDAKEKAQDIETTLYYCKTIGKIDKYEKSINENGEMLFMVYYNRISS